MTQHKKRCPVHRYRRIRQRTGRIIFACTDCPHYLEKDYVREKEHRCNSCGQFAILDSRALSEVRPVCPECRARRSHKIAKIPGSITDVLKKVLEEGK